MTTYPPIGTRVSYAGSIVVGACTGTVQSHYENDFVRVKVDEIPNEWPYGHRDTFAPNIRNLTIIDKEAAA